MFPLPGSSFQILCISGKHTQTSCYLGYQAYLLLLQLFFEIVKLNSPLEELWKNLLLNKIHVSILFYHLFIITSTGAVSSNIMEMAKY